MASNRAYLEKLVVGGGLAEGAAVLDSLLEFGGLGDHFDSRYGSVVSLWCLECEFLVETIAG